MTNDKQKLTELERLYQRSIEKLTHQIADLTAHLSIAHAQIDLIKEQQRLEKQINKKEKKENPE